MTGYRASQTVLRHTMTGRVEQKWCAVGDTREQAFFALKDDIKRANAGKVRQTVEPQGKPFIGRDRA